MDTWLRHRFLEVLRAPLAAFPCAASAVYGLLRSQAQFRGQEDLAKRSIDQEGLASLPWASGHLVDWRPDVHQSSHRTLARFVKALVKEGTITAKEVRKELQVTSVCPCCLA